MTIKNEDVVPLANKLLTYYAVDGTVIAAFDDTLGATWLIAFNAEIGVVTLLENPETITEDMVAFTKTCLDNMELLPAKFVTLKYMLKKCIKAGSITDSLGSFLITQMNNAIYKKDFEKLKFYYVTAKALIDTTANTAALIAAGYSSVKIAAIDTLYTNAKNANTSYASSQTARVTLVPLNNTQTKKLKGMCSDFINGGHACFSDPLIPTKRKLYVATSVMKLIRPTLAKKMKNKKVPKTTHKIAKTNPVLRDTNKFKNNGKDTLYVVLSNSKVGPYSGGLAILPGQEIDLKTTAIPGSGKYIIIYNLSTNYDGLMGFLTIKGA